MAEENNNIVLFVIISGVYGLLKTKMRKRRKKRRKRKHWVRPLLQRREERGAFYKLVRELQLTDKEDFRRFLRMNTETFQVYSLLLLLLINISES